MALKVLLPHEKMILRRQARRDLERKQFKPMSIRENDSMMKYPFGGANPSNTGGDIPPEQVIYVSPFMKLELEKFGAMREYQIGMKKIATFNLQGPLFRRFILSDFASTLKILDSTINDTSKELNLLEARHRDLLDECGRAIDECKSRKLPHMEQLYINKATATRRAFYKKAKKHYTRSIYLLNKKLLRIDSLKGKLNALRRKIYLRVQYYYQSAAEQGGGFLSSNLSDTHFEKISNMTVLDHYEQVRQEASDKLQDLMDDLSNLKVKIGRDS